MGPIGKAFKAQLQLVATFAEMTPYLTMKALFGDGYTKGTTLPGGDEIGAFIDAEKMLKERHGETMFPFCKVLRLQDTALVPVHFPNLCKVANTRKRKLDGTFRNYRSTNLTDKEVEHAISYPPMKKRMMSSRDITGIKKSIPLSDEEITASYSYQRNEDESSGSSLEAMSLNDLITWLP